MLPKKNRLNLRTQSVSGRRFSTPELSIITSPSKTTQIAVVVSKKVSPKAVVRNTLKRKILNILKNKLDQISPHSIIFITNSKTLSLDQSQLINTTNKLLSKIDTKPKP